MFGQFSRQPERHGRTGIGLQRGARVVGRQLQHRDTVAQLLGPVRRHALALAACQQGVFPSHEVGRVCRRRQLGRLSLQEGGIAQQQFLAQDRQRPGIADDMVKIQQQQAGCVRRLEQGGAEGAVFEVEGLVGG